MPVCSSRALDSGPLFTGILFSPLHKSIIFVGPSHLINPCCTDILKERLPSGGIRIYSVYSCLNIRGMQTDGVVGQVC